MDSVTSLPTTVLDAISDPVSVKDADTRYLWVNAAFERLFGVAREDLTGRLDAEVMPARHGAQRARHELRVLAGGETGEITDIVIDPVLGEREIITRTSRLTVDERFVLVTVLHDVTELATVSRELERAGDQLQAQAEQLRLTAITDPLTGCLNRDALYDLGAELLDHDRPMGAILMGLDHFTAIDETYGHGAGDAVLVRFAELVRSCVRSDDLIARRGGQEFLVLLPGASPDETNTIARRIRSMLAETMVDLDGRSIHCTVSIGAAHRAGDLGLEKIIDDADRLLYRAKDHGRNRVVVG